MLRRTSIFVLLACTSILAGCSGMQNAGTQAPPADPSILALVGGDPVTLDTFEEEYAKTAGSLEQAREDSLEAYADFLQRYVDYLLKVRAAQDLGYSDDPQIIAEMNTYRREFGFPYMLEDEVVNPLVREFYERSKWMIDASHILLRVGPDAAPEDTLATYRRMQTLADSLEMGADFGELAMRHSEDPSAAMEGRRGYQGRLGYFTTGQLVGPFEHFAYETPVGEISPIFRTRFGYHILKVHDRHETPDDIRVSHILIRVLSRTEENLAEARATADSLYAELMAGADFAELAREHSEDPGTAREGGDLGYVRYASPLVEPFKEAAFELEEPGDISEPVETRFGYHIIKLHDRRPRATLSEVYNELKARIEQMPSYDRALRDLIDSSMAAYDAQIDSAAIRSTFADAPEDSLLFYLVEGNFPNQQATFAGLEDTAYTFDDFADYLSSRHIQGEITIDKMYELAHQFLVDNILYHRAAQLEETDPYFRSIMEGFKDGLMLFALMQDSVWMAAGQDSVALRAYFAEHRGSYHLPERMQVISIQSPSDSLLTLVHEGLEEGEGLLLLIDTYEEDSTDFAVDTLFLSEPTESIYDEALSLQEGGYTEVIDHNGSFLLLMHGGVKPPRPMTFEEARAQVVNAYQDVLEEQLIERLRDKYDARVFPMRLRQAFQQSAQTQASVQPSPEK